MASSEEIEAALEAAIAMMRQAFDDTPNESLRGPYNALRTHLSRLREEARFRDAAMRVGRNVDLYGWGWPGEQTEIWREAGAFVEAYRALERE